ncbi:MAG: nucleotidyl transferase AbiEii/AbiGii toxin family protein [Spirochaetia bacterium]|nr:nucleotidyl transferase AbiEii/AbiGii toxin family protein [Spirochaetia bacterium]
MIDPKCFGAEWQERKRSELGGCDPVLLEKTIHAFALLDALAEKGLEFIFKGGTSLLLRLPRIRRLSIDADIICEQPDSSLDRLLAEVSQSRPFTRMAEDERGPNRLPSRRHFKFYYVPLDPRNPAPFVLLDVVKERSLYPKVEALPLRTAFVEGDGSLLVPTVEGLLGDKLTAFGPNTTGIPLSDRYSMHFMKQVFDIGELFDAASDISEARKAYESIFAAENRYRGGRFTSEQALDDAYSTAYCMAQVGLSGAPTDGRCELMELGRRQLESHLVGARFRREEMKTAAAKAALLTQAMRSNVDLPGLRYSEASLSTLKTLAFPEELAAIRRLKAVPEAMWYWSMTARLRADGR